MANIIGIDLGTTNSVIAYLDTLGKPKIQASPEGDHLTPSVVAFEGSNVIVGEESKKMLQIDSSNVFSEFKREMGSDTKFSFKDKKYSASDLSSFVLKKLIQNTEESLGKVDEIIVTIPANFSNEAREDTIRAGKLAGYDVKYIINEPTAAAIYYARELNLASGIYGVYDFGGGTFDVSIVSIEEDSVEVITSSGVNKLGGKDLDDKLFELIALKFKSTTNEELQLGTVHELAVSVEDTKKTLSSRETAPISVFGGTAGRTNFDITREEFEKAITVYITQAEMLCEQALEDSGKTVDDINDIFLVGGSTRVPAIVNSVAKLFNKTPKSIANPDEVVALGAALYAGFQYKDLLNPQQKNELETMELQEVTNHYFGTFAIVSGADHYSNDIVIHKNSAIPAEVTKTYYTQANNQRTVNCEVTQSSAPETDPKFVKIVWEGKLPLPPNRPAGQPIDVTFKYDINQVMHCLFKDVGTNEIVEVNLNSKGGEFDNQQKFDSTKDEIDAFLIE
ncbi:MAG: Hsp70 family protein [Dehalococcoidia bacterium]